MMLGELKPSRFEEVTDAETLLGWVATHAITPGIFQPFMDEVKSLFMQAPTASMSSTVRDKGKWKWAPDPKLYNACVVRFFLRTEEATDAPLAHRAWVFLMDDTGDWIETIKTMTQEQIGAMKWTD